MIFQFIFFTCFQFFHVIRAHSFFAQTDVDANSVAKIIRNYEYPLELHNITTEDGYILTTFRIPHGRNSSNYRDSQVRKPIVFMMHGLMSSCFENVCTGPEKGLGFLLADRGFDVWMGNARGNIISRRHVSLNPDEGEDFWRFSWHEIGVYDLPANIDYITNLTGQSKINYIGNSQGTTTFMVMCSERPEYNKRINLMVALAPVVYMGHAKGLFPIFAGQINMFQAIFTMFNIYEMFPKPILRTLRFMIPSICLQNKLVQGICTAIMLPLIGIDGTKPVHFDQKMLPLLLKYGLTGASTRQLRHFAQLINSGNFQKYDYGESINIEKYNSSFPPTYNLSNVVAPVAIYYGESDIFAAQEDIDKLTSELPNLIICHRLDYKYFNHYDYILAKNVNEVLYTKMFKLLVESG